MEPVSTSSQSHADRMRIFRPNRARFPLDRLLRHVGQWVAFNAEGTDIVASGADMDALMDRLAELGIDWQAVVLERVDEGDSCIGGAEYL